MNNTRVLFILHLPPPVHGAAMMGKYIKDSKIINECIDARYINLTLARDLNDIGKSSIRKFRDFIMLLVHIREEIKRFKPELCYVTPNAKGGAFYKDFVVVEMLKAMGQKVVVHYHNKGVATRQDKTFDNILYKIFFKKLKVILLAEQLYPDIKKYVARKNVYFCPNGIPKHKEISIIKEHDGFNILFLSNMMEAKGVWDLINACKLLKEKGQKFKCHFVGKWSDITEKDFKDRINELDLKNTVYSYGAKYGEEKKQFYEIANCFILPTHNECFPLVLLEAMEQSLACIATDEGGIKSIIDENTTGFIFNKKFPEELADKIERLMNNPIQCKEMGNAGKIKFENEFTIDKFENRMKDIILEIISLKS